MRLIKTLESLDNTKKLEFYVQPEGMFRFFEMCLDYEDMSDFEGMGLESFWNQGKMSGLYATLEEAEQDAYVMVSWLRDMKH